MFPSCSVQNFSGEFTHEYGNVLPTATAFGRFLDAQAPIRESGYWEVVKTKSSPFFGVALQLGALVGGSSVETAERIRELGCLYGEMIQIYDDMHDSMEAPANPDWLQGRFPLPILFASLVNHPERPQFLELRKHIDQSSALKDAQEILIQCGAISYCADQLVRRNQKAMGILSRMALVDPQPVSNLFEKVIAPVDKLLKTFDL